MKIKTLRTDNGKEYLNSHMTELLRRSGIKHQTSTPYTPQQNGLAERMNHTIVEKPRCMLFDADLSKKIWAEAVSTAAYLVNRIPCSSTNKNPYEIWHEIAANLDHLRVFGCKAMDQVPSQSRAKFYAKSSECIMMGYSDISKAYQIFDSKKKKIVTSRRDIVSFENQQSRQWMSKKN